MAALVACGSAGDEKAIRATLAAYEKALTAKDFKQTCKSLTGAAQETGFCIPVGDDPALQNEAIVTFMFKVPAITEIDVDGDRAEVRHERGEPTRMRKVDGRWLIDSGL